MVSYYNHHFTMYPKNSTNLPYTASPASWYSGNYPHQPPNHSQFMGSESDLAPQPGVYTHYPHHAVFHQSSPDWAGHESFAAPPQLQNPNGIHSVAGVLGLNHNTPNNNNENMNDGLHSIPSPPITVSGSDMSSPGAPNGSSSPQIQSRPTPVKSPFEWMKKPSYQSQPNPGKPNSIVHFISFLNSKYFSFILFGLFYDFIFDFMFKFFLLFFPLIE